MMIRDQLTRPHTVQLQMDNTQTILYSSQYVVNELRSTDSDTVQSVEYSILNVSSQYKRVVATAYP